MARRIPWTFVVAATLIVLLGALATLQYRWLGDVSQAERERMRAGLQTRASDFSEAFDRELTHAYVAFHVDGEALTRNPAGTLAAALAAWQGGAMAPGIVRAVYLLDRNGPEQLTLARLDPARGTLEKADWPASLEAWRARAFQPAVQVPGLPPPSDALDAAAPALLIHVPAITRVDRAIHLEMFTTPGSTVRAVIVELDLDRLRKDVVDRSRRSTRRRRSSEYLVTIVRRSDPASIVYTSDSRRRRWTPRTPMSRRRCSPSVRRRSSARSRRTRCFTVRPGAVHENGDHDRAAHQREDARGRRVTQGGWRANARYRSGSLDDRRAIAAPEHAIGAGSWPCSSRASS